MKSRRCSASMGWRTHPPLGSASDLPRAASENLYGEVRTAGLGDAHGSNVARICRRMKPGGRHDPCGQGAARLASPNSPAYPSQRPTGAPAIKEVPMSTTKKPVDNGVNVEALLGARQALTETPEGAKFTWRATCEWVKGTHSRSTIEEFYGLGEEQKHRQKYIFDADHPE